MPQRIYRRITRRQFLAATTVTTASLLAGCASPSPAGEEAITGATSTRVFAPGTASDGPLPTPSPGPPGPTLAEMAGGILLLGFRGTLLTETNPIVADIRDRHLGGVILFGYDVAAGSPVRNITSPAQLAALTASLRTQAGGRKLLIATDQEGGLVARLDSAHGFPATPSHAELGARADPNYTRTIATSMGATLLAAGIGWNLAPVLDLNVNPANPVIGALGRSFSADPAVVSSQAAAFIDGLHAKGILVSAKHFPGHGSSRSDSHAGFVDITNTWSPAELLPYRDLIPKGLLDSVLVAHVFNANLDPDFPASLSTRVIDGMLRRDMGYTGLVVSDDMQMGAITKLYSFNDAIRLALNAGNDILTFGNNLDSFDPDLGAKAHGAILDLVRTGDVTPGRLAEAYGRAEALRKRA